MALLFLGNRIKKLRRTLDLTQQAFGERIGTTQNNIASYETGRREPSAAALNNICKTFNANEEWLRTGEGEMFLQTTNNILDALTEKYGLSHEARVLIEEFINLKPDIQQAFVSYAVKVAHALASDVSMDIPENGQATIEEAEARAEAEEYYRAILAEKEAAAGLSASPDSISGAKLA